MGDRFREGGRVRQCDRIAQSVTGWSLIKMGGGGGGKGGGGDPPPPKKKKKKPGSDQLLLLD